MDEIMYAWKRNSYGLLDKKVVNYIYKNMKNQQKGELHYQLVVEREQFVYML